MCPQCPTSEKLSKFSTIAYNGVRFSFGPFSSILPTFDSVWALLSVLTVLTCPHPSFSKRILLCSISTFSSSAKSSPLHAPYGLVLPAPPTFPTIHFLSSTPFLNFRQVPLPNCGLLSPSKQAPEHPLSRPRMPHLYLQSIKYYPPRLNSI